MSDASSKFNRQKNDSVRRNDDSSSSCRHYREEKPVAVKVRTNDETNRLPELGKLLLAFLILFIAAMSNGLVMSYTHQYAVKYLNKTEPLDDGLFRLIPLIQWTWIAADACTGATISLSFIFLIFHRRQVTVYKRAALIAAFLYCLRGVTLISTYLPPPFPSDPLRCLPAIDISSEPFEYLNRAFILVAKMGSSSDGNLILCGDTIFSGHTMIVVLSYWFLQHYCPQPLRLIALLVVFPLALLSIIFLIISRQHYTVDVVVATFLSLPVLQVYHFWLTEKRRQYVKGPSCVLHPLHNLFVFFESNKDDGTLANELSWPLRWPECLVAYFQSLNRIRLSSEQVV
ncbi:Phosphatidylcholine:ceramide cholinephosphotransf erase 2 [Trichuris trichiura]|uniref:Phosphatidylcholine:ceramide cholinephosphotransf erase 2 n=1 Tax=Trichuris trichiura TaxID=36087 RepID=A0A077YZX0_TRITR|nr:Phosphatidylcholine:ceramide cholinephosphotransf erase 2 [Trichuris trichiura]